MLDISHVAPDPTALAHADDCRKDNATGTDAGLSAAHTSGLMLRLTGRDPMLRGSAPLTKGQLLKQLKRWNIEYIEVTRHGVPWYEHHRPASTGQYGSMHGVLNHHTGPFSTVKGMLALLWDGRSDLPGPLCHVSTDPDGILYLVGWNGRANHAGLGASNIYKALLADKAPPKTGKDSVDGNAILYGNEVMQPGKGHYPPEQIETAVRFSAAILEWHKWKPASAIQHKEWTTRKVDMSWHHEHGGDDFRAEVARALKEGPDKYSYPAAKTPPAPTPPAPPTPPKDDEMPTAQEVAAAVLAAPLVSMVDGEKRSLGDLIRYTHKHASDIDTTVTTLQAEVAAIAAASGLTDDQLAKIRAAVADELAKGVAVSVTVAEKTA